MNKYLVPIVSRQLTNYLVEAYSAKEAQEAAVARFHEDDAGDSCGNEWETIESIGEADLVPSLIGARVHLDCWIQEWGRVVSDGEVMVDSGDGYYLVAADSIRANIFVEGSELHVI